MTRIGTMVLLLLALAVAGCGDDPTSTEDQTPSPDLTNDMAELPQGDTSSSDSTAADSTATDTTATDTAAVDGDVDAASGDIADTHTVATDLVELPEPVCDSTVYEGNYAVTDRPASFSSAATRPSPGICRFRPRSS